MRDDRGVRVEALGLGLNEQSRNGDASLFQSGHHRERRVTQNQRRLVRRPSRALQRPFNSRAVDVGDRRDARERGAQVRFGSRQQGHCVAGDIFCEHASVAIVNDAAGRRERNRAQPVGLRLQLILAVTEDLDAKERQYEDADHHPDDAARQAQAAIE